MLRVDLGGEWVSLLIAASANATVLTTLTRHARVELSGAPQTAGARTRAASSAPSPQPEIPSWTTAFTSPGKHRP
jgi:hypothetical protein